LEHITYISEIEEHFQRRRGSVLICSPLDWALMEVWKEAGVPLEAALRGIDAAFDKYERRKSVSNKSKTRKVNSLAYCQQEVLAAVEELKEAATGSARDPSATGIANQELARYFERNAQMLERTAHPAEAVCELASTQAAALRELAGELVGAADSPAGQSLPHSIAPHSPKEGGCGPPVKEGGDGPPVVLKETPPDLEALERRMTVMEEKLFAALWSHATDEELIEARAQAERELAPYRGKMSAAQIDQLLRQYGNKQLLEKYKLPRLSLFYL
jgi:hypothetical protein